MRTSEEKCPGQHKSTYPCSDQTSAGRVDELNSLLCVQRRLNSKPCRNETKILVAVVEPELLTYTDVACITTDVVVCKLFALSS